MSDHIATRRAGGLSGRARERLHIAMYTNVYIPTTNGVVTSVRTFRESLTKRGHVVYVIAPHATEPCRPDERLVFRYPAMELPLQRYPLTVPVSPFMDLLLPCLGPDVLHAHHPVMLGGVAAKKSRTLGVPLVFTHHTRYQEYSHYVKGIPEHMARDFLESWVAGFMRKCHHVIVPSESIRDLLEVTYGISTRVSVVATGVDPTRFSRMSPEHARIELGWNPEDTIILSMGRLAKEKNWELLMRAVASCHPTPGLRLVIVGGGEELEGLEILAWELGIAQSVTFTGPVPSEIVPTYLRAADIFAFASLTETQGLATLEAMASELPIVAVEASGTRDVLIDGQGGFLTSSDSEALAAKLRRLIADPALRRQLGEAALKRSADFNIARQTARLEAVYRTAIEDYAAGYRVSVPAVEPRTGLRRLLSYLSRTAQGGED